MAERQRQARLHQAHQAEAQQRYRAQTMAAQHEALPGRPRSVRAGRAAAEQQREEAAGEAAAAGEEARANALSQARKRSSTFQRSRGAVPQKRGLLGKIFSVKGALLLLPLGYLYVSHRGLLASLAGIAVKYPALLSVWILKTLWRLVLKPTAGFMLKLSRGGGAQLPGGSY